MNCDSPSLLVSTLALSPEELLSLSPLDVAETSSCWLSLQLSGGCAAAAQEASQEAPVPGRGPGRWVRGPHRNAVYLSGLLLPGISHCLQKNMTLIVADSPGDHFWESK